MLDVFRKMDEKKTLNERLHGLTEASGTEARLDIIISSVEFK